jgi:hypothetical protein
VMEGSVSDGATASSLDSVGVGTGVVAFCLGIASLSAKRRLDESSSTSKPGDPLRLSVAGMGITCVVVMWF